MQGLGWNPDRAKRARDEMLASGRYATVVADPTPRPANKAKSLASKRLRSLRQGGAGTCWIHAAVQAAEIRAVAKGLKAFPVCRRLVGYAGKRLEGGGNPSEGGAVSDAFLAMTAEKGFGLAHESLLPYSDNYSELGRKPPQNVIDDAKASHLILPVDVTADDQIKTLIDNEIAVGVGIWWSAYWDSRQTIFDRAGSGSYGHAPLVIGYAEAGVIHDQACWQFDNWHSDLYPRLDPDRAKLVEGYEENPAELVSHFWMTDPLFQWLKRGGNFECVTATDVNGIESNVVETDWSGVFPV